MQLFQGWKILLMVQLSVDKLEDVMVIRPLGELTGLYHLSDIRKLVDDYIEKENHLFVFDMSEVTHMDSSGLGVFFAIYKKVTAIKGKMIMTKVPEKLRRVFELMRFQSLVTFKDTVEEAVEAVKQ